MRKRPTRTDHKVHDQIMKADRARGFTMWEVAQAIRVTVLLVEKSVDYLVGAKLIESRWCNERWPNGDRAIKLPESPKIGGRYYRITCKSKQTLGAHLRETIS